MDTRDETNIHFLRVWESALINTINTLFTISNICFCKQHSPIEMKVDVHSVFTDFL